MDIQKLQWRMREIYRGRRTSKQMLVNGFSCAIPLLFRCHQKQIFKIFNKNHLNLLPMYVISDRLQLYLSHVSSSRLSLYLDNDNHISMHNTRMNLLNEKHK